ncbi:MAG: metallophosphoesterase [Alphaproteobacteria bacterium]|uniref:Metallophosphoesterase n=1 Tax=Candidatus Nitrobium versatile TaxID=2884831 RepID=A0A953M206_9BACT|nr:metallophosphoesterase [Candidatus Nitrobium versatile]
MKTEYKTIRLAAVGDIHYTRKSPGALKNLFSQATEVADVLLLCGDLTDNGHPDEAHTLAADLTSYVKIPLVGVLGNHDYESGKHAEVRDILSEAGVSMLDGSACEIQGVGFAGVKGFCGGFGRQALQPWGEDIIKRFVQETVDEALRLEKALAKLEMALRVVLLHYAPVKDTIEGEHPEIFTYLGSSRIEEPLNRCQVSAVFHGHAHSGSPEGRTREGIPVYNVSMPLLHRMFPDRPSFRLVEIQK